MASTKIRVVRTVVLPLDSNALELVLSFEMPVDDMPEARVDDRRVEWEIRVEDSEGALGGFEVIETWIKLGLKSKNQTDRSCED